MRKAICIPFIVMAAVLILAVGCTGKDSHPHGKGGAKAHEPQASDTLYTEEKAMDVYAHEPQRALTIIDSAEIVGNLADYQADLLRSKVYGRSMEMLRLDTARTICETLLRHDSVKANDDLQVKVLDQLINVSRLRQDHEQWLRWATEKANLCHELAKTKPTDAERNEAETEALRTEAEIGVIQTHLGQQNEGLARLDYIISRLNQPGSVNRFDALMIAQKRKINVLMELGRTAEVVQVGKQVLGQLGHFAQHPGDYAEDSDRLPDDSTHHAGYIDFCHAQTYAFLAKAYTAPTAPLASAAENKSEALRCLSLFEKTDFSKTFTGRRLMAPVWLALGEYDKVLASFAEQEQQMKDDTVCEDYAFILSSRAEIAERKGRLAESLSYRHRYEALTDTLNARLQESKAHDYAARYQLQEQRIETERLKARTAHNRLINIGVDVAIALLLAALVWHWRQRRIISRKNRSLVRQISEAIKYKKMYEEIRSNEMGHPEKQELQPEDEASQEPDTHESQTEKTAETDQLPVSLNTLSHDQLFEHIHNVIKREKLYLNPAFDRQTVIDHLHLSKERIGQAFSQGSDYNSLSDFIRDCRLEHACELLSTTNMPIGDIATASGFSRITTFNHDFKEKYDVAPSIYRQQFRR